MCVLIFTYLVATNLEKILKVLLWDALALMLPERYTHAPLKLAHTLGLNNVGCFFLSNYNTKLFALGTAVISGKS